MAKRERKPIETRLAKENSLDKQEEILQQRRKVKERRTKEKEPTTRITIDLPNSFYLKVKEHVEDQGQTIKGFFINLAKEHFRNL